VAERGIQGAGQARRQCLVIGSHRGQLRQQGRRDRHREQADGHGVHQLGVVEAGDGARGHEAGNGHFHPGRNPSNHAALGGRQRAQSDVAEMRSARR
jgi:hypothetical protein